MPQSYFSKIFPRLKECLRQEIPSALPLNNASLLHYLDSILSSSPGEKGNLINDPAFEAMFGWQEADVSMAELSGKLLDERLISCLSNPPEELRQDYAFPLNRRPYTHQLGAWKTLCADKPSSVVVSSGTGSGKTECFMIPILDRLSRQSSEHGGSLQGVHALFLYPLNALISSQRDRLDAWTRGFNGDIRFCLYNGKTPESLPSHVKRSPNEVLSREDLRACPPPILFTNATMLEYMLVRTEDAPILQKSQGKLEWIVLDEAHCYIGSQAAELSLLLRRAQMAFGVKPDTVRFVATSATIGDPNGPAGHELKKFLADVAGVPVSQVIFIAGKRKIPSLPQLEEQNSTLDALESIAPTEAQSDVRYEALCSSKTAKALREIFTQGKNVAKLSEIRTLLRNEGCPGDAETALRWLDVLSWTQSKDSTPFLPLRAHMFGRGFSGLWACADPSCPHKQKELQNDWPFGAVWTEPREHCECGSPVFEVVTCRGCHTPFLLAENSTTRDSENRPAEFLSQKRHTLELEEEESIDEEEVKKQITDSYPVLLMRSGSSSEARWLDKNTSRTLEADNGHAVRIFLKEPNTEVGDLVCPLCNELPRGNREFYSYNFISTAYLQNTIAPVLLEFAPDGKDPAQHPFRGRKILTFSDSRQGTARSAMRMQLFSELTHIRGLLYHIGLRECRGDNAPDIEKLEKEIAALEIACSGNSSSTLQTILNDKKQECARLKDSRPISFADMAKQLQNERSSFDSLFRLYQEGRARMVV